MQTIIAKYLKNYFLLNFVSQTTFGLTFIFLNLFFGITIIFFSSHIMFFFQQKLYLTLKCSYQKPVDKKQTKILKFYITPTFNISTGAEKKLIDDKTQNFNL